ncbi:MAG TPA: valine--tRNA ligase [Euryarchaeota archaeon]|nr:valine--tRNA ligase [Euryarchaeota archaeon]
MTPYDHKASEKKWSDKWEEWKIYHFDFHSDKKPYTIDNPPRYASGPLHLGHATHYTHIDFVARYKRMRGYNVMFPLCFDVNGMPIEVNVEKKYGVKMGECDRQEFIKLCREFANANIGEMTRQFRILGESMDETAYYQTDAEYYRRLTQISFIKMHKMGVLPGKTKPLVYKGRAPVNWCPRCATAISDAEIEYKKGKTQLNDILFTEMETKKTVTIATTRPELLCTCHMVAVHPDDESKSHLVGKILQTPIFDRKVEVVADTKVDPEFGSGVVMVCTIGDKDDLDWAYKYNLPMEIAISKDGKMNELAEHFCGLDISEARTKAIQQLKDEGTLTNQTEVDHNVGTCWRCKTPIEFLEVPQWFINITEFKEEVLRIKDEIDWYPQYMKVRLEEWVNSLNRDWVVSRQRWFATPIPVWECLDCGEAVFALEEMCYVDPTIIPPPVKSCEICGGELKGCSDVFDTWMDSSISPLYNTFWERDDNRFDRLYPMSLRPQSHDIIRTWAFYTIIREYLVTNKRPWNDIMMGGFILSADGTPMHASLGNVIDPLSILDRYGGDALRYYASTCSLGEDNAFREKDVVRGSRLLNKMYNVHKFIGSRIKGHVPPTPPSLKCVDQWLLRELDDMVEKATKHMEVFEYDKAMKLAEYFIWHSLADHYIELVKHRNDDAAKFVLYHAGLNSLKVAAVVLPFVSEDIYQEHYALLNDEKSIHVSPWPVPLNMDIADATRGEFVKELAAEVRTWKSTMGMPLNKEFQLLEIIGPDAEKILGSEDDITNTTGALEIRIGNEKDLEEVYISVKPDKSVTGPKYKQNAAVITDVLKKVDPKDIGTAFDEGGIFLIRLEDGTEIEILPEDVKLEKSVSVEGMKAYAMKVMNSTILAVE